MSGKGKIFDWLVRNDLPDGMSNFDDVLIDAIEQAFPTNRIDAERIAQSNRIRYWNCMIQHVDSDLSAGRVPSFHIPDPNIRKFSCYGWWISNGGQPAGLRLRSRSAVLRAIDQLNSRDYEALGCVASEICGAARIHLTPSGNEGGIDFVALIKCTTNTRIFGGAGGQLRVVGQSKKYSGAAQVNRINEFITTLGEVRHRAGRPNEVLPLWFHESRGPVVGWIIGHAGFQSGATDKAKNHGIILSDSRDISEIISVSPSFHSSDDATARIGKVTTEITRILGIF